MQPHPADACSCGLGGEADRAAPGGNRLLAAMPGPEAARLRAALEPIRLAPGMVLFEPGQAIEHATFPDSGAISVLSGNGSGRRIEIVLVGQEGMLGLSALLGGAGAMHRAVVQLGGEARRVPLAPLRALLHGSLAMRDLLLHYAALRLAQAASGVSCNALHPLRARTARRLLELQDRAGADFLLTQDILADMLGARRPTVNAVLQGLKAEGILATARGRIAITDAPALEAVACGCRGRLLEAARALDGAGRAGGDGQDGLGHGG